MKTRVLCFLCILTVLCSICVFNTQVGAVSVPGDLNGNGTVTDDDAVWLLMYSFFPEEYPITQPSACDYDKNGIITADDAIYLLMYTFFPTTYPIAPPADTRVINGTTYNLTFVDEFEGTKLDSSKWACCPEWERADVGGRWEDDMVSVKNGCLYLGAAIDDNGTPVSGAVQTMSKWYQVKWSQCKGYFECRAKLQSAPGFWGAFWLMTRSMGNNDVGQGASNGAEIDIMESFSVAQGGINHAIHWDGYNSNHQSTGKSIYNKSLYDGKFHTFAMAWTDTEYIFYIDGAETYRVGNSNVANIICLDPAYLLLTVEFGTWAGTINKTKLPDAVVVDYVRVYQAA